MATTRDTKNKLPAKEEVPTAISVFSVTGEEVPQGRKSPNTICVAYAILVLNT